MNREKKEEIRKYYEARQGKCIEEIAEIDSQDKVEDQIRKLASLLHGRLFFEEYDFMSDSSADAYDRKKGINPMSEAYIKKVDDKRRVLGFTPLSSGGKTSENDTLDFCLSLARGTLSSENN